VNKLEQLAEQLHEGWREHQAGRGRVLGPARTERTHPHMLPWAELDDDSRDQDRFMAAVVLDDWCRGRLSREDLPRAIHEAWRRWVGLLGRPHPHALPFDVAHAKGAEEHDVQARRLEPLLRTATRTNER
jgi:hypothetical protein